MALPYGVKREETTDLIVHHFGIHGHYDDVKQQVSAFYTHFKKHPEFTYHYFVATDGSIYKGNDESVVVWHANNNEVNDKSVAICLWGNLSKRKPTSEQIESLTRLLSKLIKKYKIKPQNILGHRDVGDTWTECPGAYLYIMLPQIAKEAAKMAEIPQWKIDATKKAKNRGWLKSPHSPDEKVDVGFLSAFMLNVAETLDRESNSKRIEKKVLAKIADLINSFLESEP